MRTKRLLPVVLLSCILALFTFSLLIRFDNKYSWPGPKGEHGVTDLRDYNETDFIYLVQGWEIYEDCLLTPEQLKAESPEPDRYIYLGQYGGFEFGSRDRTPDGSVTYRMRLLLDDEERAYQLELPEIYSAYRLWINGQLVRIVGNPDPAAYRPATQMASEVFRAAGEAELVFEVTNYTAFYSGMVYPPAFGDPDAVLQMQNLRLILHMAVSLLALFLGVVCLVYTVLERGRLRMPVFFLLCICYAPYTGYPLIHTLRLTGIGWYQIEKVCLYGMLLMLVILAGDIGQLSVRLRTVFFALGSAVCLLVLSFPYLPMRWNVDVMNLYSRMLFYWQWLVAGYLFYVSAVIIKRGPLRESALLPGAIVYGISLLINAGTPLLEPVYTGWPTEISGLVLVVIIGGILIGKSRENHQSRIQAMQQREMAEQSFIAQKQHSEMLAEYMRLTGKRNHEVKKNLELLRHYYEQQEYGQLGDYLSRLSKAEQGIKLPFYTVNPLINSIVAIRFRKAAECGIQTESNFLSLPPVLFVDDHDLCSLLLNLLDNAIEGCLRLPENDARRLMVGMEARDGYFSVLVENSAPEPEPGRQQKTRKTQKKDAFSHGYGMGIIAEIAEKYNGMQQVRWENKIFIHQVILFAPAAEAPEPDTAK